MGRTTKNNEEEEEAEEEEEEEEEEAKEEEEERQPLPHSTARTRKISHASAKDWEGGTHTDNLTTTNASTP